MSTNDKRRHRHHTENYTEQKRCECGRVIMNQSQRCRRCHLKKMSQNGGGFCGFYQVIPRGSR